MRLISWNCCDAFERKFGHLERLRPDVAVISEVRPECLRSAALLERSIWIGDPGQKGLAIIPYGDWRIAAEGPKIAEKWFAPVRLSNGVETLQIVGAWLDTNADCVYPTLTALDHLESFLAAGPTILAGDFNQSVVFDTRHREGRRFQDVLERLARTQLASAWHTHTGEAQGSEKSATLYWRFDKDKPFHIDYVFYPAEVFDLVSVSLGTYEQYVETKISDHVPLIADLVRRSAAIR
ncbi:MAG TPA: endonuclease/exonuclease/phosphatase family protein [Stellaceae bacterium]|nr:endonuclease/exonuclease/phosphatase family protein [Stellaceae bacterium]